MMRKKRSRKYKQTRSSWLEG